VTLRGTPFLVMCVVEVLRGRPQLGCAAMRRAFAPWFGLEKRLGSGVEVPPSDAEPWILEHRSHGDP
jgi:hypothetical protein